MFFCTVNTNLDTLSKSLLSGSGKPKMENL